MSGYQLMAGANDFHGREILDPDNAIPARHDSSLSDPFMNGYPTSPEMSPSTMQNSPESDVLLSLRPLEITQHGGAADNVMLSVNSADMELNITQNSWIDTVITPVPDVTETDDTEVTEAAGWLMNIRNDGMAHRSKRQEFDNDVEPDGTPRGAKKPRLPVPVPHGTRVASKGRLPSLVPKHRVALVKAKSTGTRTPLPSCRALIELIPEAVELKTQERLEDSKFGQNFVTGRGWTSINGPQTLLRPEDDLAIEINTIIRAPYTATSSTNSAHSSASSPPAIDSTSPGSTPSSRSVNRASPRKRLAARAKTLPASPTSRPHRAPPRSSTNTVATTAGPSSSSSNQTPAPHSAAPSATPSDTSSSPTSPPASPRRPKWTGKPFRELTLEALRGATTTGHALDLAGIVAYIEEYRLTTDMQLPALNQTIRAAIHRLCVHKKPTGLWEREVVEGSYTGRYVLVQRALDLDVEVEGSSGEEEEDEGEESEEDEEVEEEEDEEDKEGNGKGKGKKEEEEDTAEKDTGNGEGSTAASTS